VSFSKRAKSEMCRSFPAKKCCLSAELYGILLFANTFSDKEIKINTESRDVAKRISALFKRVMDIDITRDGKVTKKSERTIISVLDAEVCRKVLSFFGYEKRDIVLHLNMGAIDETCCRAAFLRGAFLSGGAVTDPEKKYHLELITSHQSLSREVMALLLDMDFSPGTTMRKGNYLIYFKDSSAIEDFLTGIGAPVAAMALMQAKVEKGMRSAINRKVNCETANIDKMASAAAEQVRAIQNLKKSKRIDSLTESLKETARLRMKYPDIPLSELAGKFDPPISKPGLNHRLKKLIEIANETNGAEK